MPNVNRLANVIFERAEPLTESQYKSICETIDSDAFTLNEHVLDYKGKETIYGKLFFLLEDGSKVLVSKDILQRINELNMESGKLEAYMRQSLPTFQKMLETLNGDY